MNILTPFNNLAKGIAEVFGVRWGSGEKDAVISSYDHFKSIDVNSGWINGPVVPGLGPQVPAGNVATPTQAIPGAIFDSGLAFSTLYDGGSNGLRYGAISPGAAARVTTDISAWPYRPVEEFVVPLTTKIASWWNDVTTSFDSPSENLDDKKAAPSIATIAAIGAVGIAGTVAVVALAKRKG